MLCVETPALGLQCKGKLSVLLFSCGSVVLLMKDMQHPDMLSVHSGSRETLWSGGSGILAVGNFFSHSVVAVQKRLQRFWPTWKVKGS